MSLHLVIDVTIKTMISLSDISISVIKTIVNIPPLVGGRQILYNKDMKIPMNISKKENLIYARIVCGISLICLIASGIFIYRAYYDYQQAQQSNNDLKVDVVQDVMSEDEDANLLRRVDFTTLSNQNNEVDSWLYVPNTAIDGVVMQESVVGRYKYDKSNMYGVYNGFGSYLIPATPRVESTKQPAIDAHTLVLAHRMHNYNGEWQFSNVPLRWGTLEGANNYPYIYMYYPNRAERWRVWSAGDAHGYDMIYQTPYEIGSDKYGELLSYMTQSARFVTGVAVDKDTPTLVLSTCNNENVNAGRYFVASVPDATYYYDSDTLVYPAIEKQENMWRKEMEH